MTYDAAIIGGGPAGYTAALKLAEYNKNIVLFEGEKVGGTCLHRGCIPMKSFLHNAAQIPLQDVIAKADKDIRLLYKGLCGQLKKPQIMIVNSFCQIKDRRDSGFEIVSGDTSYSALSIIIATGSEQRFPNIDGLEEARKDGWILDTDAVFRYDHWGRKAAIIGAGVSGLEIATCLSRQGIEVTILEASDKILSGGMDEEVFSLYSKELGNIEMVCSASICEADEHTIIYEKNGNYEELEADQVVVATGRKARVEGIGLENIGVEVEEGFIRVDAHCMTNINGIYACGDVIGKDMLAHVAYREAEVAVSHICGRNGAITYNAVPKVVYTDPEFASVGVSEDMLLRKSKKEGIDYSVCKCPMTYSSRYVILEGLRPGICKLIFDKEEILIGAQILGNGAGELIGWAADMAAKKETKKQIRNKIYPHPSICEVLREAVR